MSESDPLLFSVDDGIATVTINRPEARNALNIAVSNGLHDLWEQIDSDPEIRVVVFTSTDCGTFCAGMDLKEAARLKAETGQDILTFHKDVFGHRMRHVRAPIIAAMTGHLMAGGMMLSLNCDIRVGLAGTNVVDLYEFNLSITGGGHDTQRAYKHAIHTRVGAGPAPVSGVEPSANGRAFPQVVEDIVVNFLRDLQAAKQLTLRRHHTRPIA